jgi:hypothetical protein
MRLKLWATFNHTVDNAALTLEIAADNLRQLLPRIIDIIAYNISFTLLRIFDSSYPGKIIPCLTKMSLTATNIIHLILRNNFYA